MLIRLRFRHGYGDAVQFGIVLKHLREAYPDAIIELETTNKREALFRHLVDKIQPLAYPWDQWRGDIIKDVRFPECQDKTRAIIDPLCPATKAAECLYSMFDIFPEPSLFRYSVSIDPAALASVKGWYDSLERPIALFHYEGANRQEKKNLPRGLIEKACRRFVDGGITPVILDWRANKIADGKTILTPPHYIPQDSDHIAALIQEGSVFFGIDSGPEHIAGALDTPTFIWWLKHWPGRYYDKADNVVHFIGDVTVDDARDQQDYDFVLDNYKVQDYGTNLEAEFMDRVDEVIADHK